MEDQNDTPRKTDIIINNLKKFRIRNELTQEELADSLGVSRQTIISIERRRYTPSLVLAVKIVQFFQCHFEEMFLMTEEQPLDPKKTSLPKTKRRITHREDNYLRPLRGLPFLD